MRMAVAARALLLRRLHNANADSKILHSYFKVLPLLAKTFKTTTNFNFNIHTTQRLEFSTSTSSFGEVHLPQTIIRNDSCEIPENLPLTFSSTLKEKLSTSRANRLQKLYNECRNPFLSDLVEIRDISEILDLIEKHAESMDIHCVNSALEIIFLLLKEEKLATRKKEYLNSVGMHKLLKLLRRKCRHMHSADLISGIKVLNLLDVPSFDTNMQILLKVLTKHANSLELSEIVYLQFLLSRFPAESKSALGTALEMALPVVFESQVGSQSQNGALDREGVQTLCDYLHYATNKHLSDKTVKPLVVAIERNLNILTPRHAMSILWSLGNAKSNESYQEVLVKACFKVAAENMDSYDLTVLSTAITKSNRKYTIKKVPFFYNEDFVHSFCDRHMMSRNKNERDQTLFSFKYISSFRHVHVEYMDKVGEIIASSPSLVLNNDILFFSLMRSFCGCNYKPEDWNKFEAMLINHPALSKDLGPQAINLAVDFLSLDSYPEVLIQRIFSPEELPKLDAFLQKNAFNTSSAHTLLLLLNSVQLLHPDYSGPLPPISMINKWKELAKHEQSNRHYSLKAALQTGFGGENYVINGTYAGGLHIDHVILMRKGGYPVAVNQTDEINDLSDIQKPPESEIVLIKVFPKEAYSNNTPRLRGVKALEQRILEKLGHPILIVDGERWTELPDHEKIPFLMHRIREKIDKLKWNKAGDVIPR